MWSSVLDEAEVITMEGYTYISTRECFMQGIMYSSQCTLTDNCLSSFSMLTWHACLAWQLDTLFPTHPFSAMLGANVSMLALQVACSD